MKRKSQRTIYSWNPGTVCSCTASPHHHHHHHPPPGTPLWGEAEDHMSRKQALEGLISFKLAVLSSNTKGCSICLQAKAFSKDINRDHYMEDNVLQPFLSFARELGSQVWGGTGTRGLPGPPLALKLSAVTSSVAFRHITGGVGIRNWERGAFL